MGHTRSVLSVRRAAASLVAAAGLVAGLGATALPAHAAEPAPSSVPNISGCTVSYVQAESHQPSGALPKVTLDPPYIIVYIGNATTLREYNVGETTHYLTCVI